MESKKNGAYKKIRVLHLIEHLEVGGTERGVVDKIKSLDPDKIESICCVYRNIGAFGEELRHSGYPLFLLKKSFVSDKLIKLFGTHLLIAKLLSLPFILLESIAFVIRLAIFIKKKKIDIVNSHLYSANFWGRLSIFFLVRPPKIITTECNTCDLNKSWKVNLGNRLLSRCSTRIVAVSKIVAESLIVSGWANQEQLLVIPNGVIVPDDSSNEEPTNKQHEVLLPGSGLKIAIIAYLWPVKRHDLLFKAVKICIEKGKEFTCLVIGDGPERAGLEQIVKNLNLSSTVIFLGERYDIPLLLKQIDIVVSTSDTEGLPRNLLEALAEGVAVVATDVGGTAEIIKHNDTGLLVESGNERDIADGICKMIDNTDLAHKLGANGKAMVQQSYSMKNIARQWQTLYENILTIQKNDRL